MNNKNPEISQQINELKQQFQQRANEILAQSNDPEFRQQQAREFEQFMNNQIAEIDNLDRYMAPDDSLNQNDNPDDNQSWQYYEQAEQNEEILYQGAKKRSVVISVALCLMSTLYLLVEGESGANFFMVIWFGLSVCGIGAMIYNVNVHKQLRDEYKSQKELLFNQ